MTAQPDYFENHQRARQFPWTLYHAPLERDLSNFLHRAAEEHPEGNVLVVGCGLLHEIDDAPPGLHYTVADIDPRAVEAVLARNDPMRPGSVLVDVAIDQGGIAETSRPTTHSEPFYVEEGIVHYWVTNMPGAVARTATLALTHATLPFVMALAGKGLLAAEENPHLGKGLQIRDGKIVHPGLAEDIEKQH